MRLDGPRRAHCDEKGKFVLGRKNHYGSRSRRSLDVAALFYSLIESAKLCGVEPKRYLLTITRTALADRSAVMLPRDFLARS